MFSLHTCRNLWFESSRNGHWYSEILKSMHWIARLLSLGKTVFCIRMWYYFAVCHFFSKTNFDHPLGKWVVTYNEKRKLLIILKWLLPPYIFSFRGRPNYLLVQNSQRLNLALGISCSQYKRSFDVGPSWLVKLFFSILFGAFCIKLWKTNFILLPYSNYTLMVPNSLLLFLKTLFFHLFHVCILLIPECMLRQKFTACLYSYFSIYFHLPCFDPFPCSNSQYLTVPILQIIQVYTR